MKKQLFYKEVLTRTKVSNNILRVFDASKEANINGLKWYNEANSFSKDLSVAHIKRILNSNIIQSKLASLSDGSEYQIQTLSRHHVAGIISALSPRQSWQGNKDLTAQFIELLEQGKDPYKLPYIKGQIEKAVRIARVEGGDVERTQARICEILKGEKTISFFLSIANTSKSNEVTIDRHALSVALGRKLSNEGLNTHRMTKGQYNFFAECYKLAAQKKGVNGLEMQAQTREFWRLNGSEFQTKLNNLLNIREE